MSARLRNFDESTAPPMFEFNYLVQACIPKKITYPHEHGVACRAAETRAISCKCNDNKTILIATAYSLGEVVAQDACQFQQGFIPGRHFTNNIVAVDTVSRIYSNLAHRYGNSISALFDFGNAFPSVIIQWILLVLQWLKAPHGIICLVRACYHEVYMYIKHAGVAKFMCLVQSGVLQGCPLAALLFVVAMGPLFNTFSNFHRRCRPWDCQGMRRRCCCCFKGYLCSA